METEAGKRFLRRLPSPWALSRNKRVAQRQWPGADAAPNRHRCWCFSAQACCSFATPRPRWKSPCCCWAPWPYARLGLSFPRGSPGFLAGRLGLMPENPVAPTNSIRLHRLRDSSEPEWPRPGEKSSAYDLGIDTSERSSRRPAEGTELPMDSDAFAGFYERSARSCGPTWRGSQATPHCR